MADVPLVTIVNGLPTAGSGTVMTISNIVGTGPKSLTDLCTLLATLGSVTATANAIDVNLKTSALGLTAATDTAGALMQPILGAATTNAPTYLTAKLYPPSLTLAGATRMDYSSFGGTAIDTPTKVKISVASATTTTLVALVSAKKIRVLAMYLVSTAANTINFQSHTTTTNADGLMGFAATSGMVLPFNPVGWFDTTSGEALDMVTSGAGQVSGQLSYVAVS